MPYTDEQILETARLIRPHLDALLGAGAAELDEELAALLARAEAGEDVADPILDLLTQHEALRRWGQR
jgi:hypothetical protein